VTERDLQLQERPTSQGEEDRAVDGLTLEDAEVWLIQRALSRHDGNPVAAAKSLGISRSALYRRLGKRKPS
jgi:transcriptional regulator with PAS, ATPase and Fis domain